MINPRQTHHRDTYIPAVREFLHKLEGGDFDNAGGYPSIHSHSKVGGMSVLKSQ
jgi:hypothetical protein